MRWLCFGVAAFALVACGGKIDDGTDAGEDSGSESGGPDGHAETGLPDTGPPQCKPNGAQCVSPVECCTFECSFGVCGGPPPPPPCKPDGAPCGSAGECCSNTCNGTCGVQVGCAVTSNKLCDQCLAQSCCNQMVACNGDAPCNMWQACVMNCEQQGSSAFACTQPNSPCDPPADGAEQALDACGQKFCAKQCTTD